MVRNGYKKLHVQRLQKSKGDITMFKILKMEKKSLRQLEQLDEFLTENPVFPGKILCRINPFTDCAINLRIAIQEDFSPGEIKDIILYHLGTLNRSDYLPEDREMICDNFFRLSLIVRVKIKMELDRFQYTPLMRFLMRIFHFFWQTRRLFETVSQACIGCQQPLTAHILEKASDIPGSNWMIISCHYCSCYNLFSFGPGVNRYRFINFSMISVLKKSAYTGTQAIEKMKNLEILYKSSQP